MKIALLIESLSIKGGDSTSVARISAPLEIKGS